MELMRRSRSLPTAWNEGSDRSREVRRADEERASSSRIRDSGKKCQDQHLRNELLMCVRWPRRSRPLRNVTQTFEWIATFVLFVVTNLPLMPH